MLVAESVRLYGRHVLWCTAFMLSACAQSPRPAAEPVLLVQAAQAQTDGLRAFARGDHESAARHFEQALRLQQSLDDVPAAAQTHLHLATVALALDQPQAALAHVQSVQALSVLKEAGLQPRLWQLQAQAYLAMNDAVAARRVLVQALADCPNTCAQRGSLLLLQAKLDLAGQQAAQALSNLQMALPLLQSQGQSLEVANVWRVRAGAHLALGQHDLALSAAQSALSQDRALALPEKIAQDWMLLGDIYQQSARQDSAREAFERAQSVAAAARLVKVQTRALERMKRLQ